MVQFAALAQLVEHALSKRKFASPDLACGLLFAQSSTPTLHAVLLSVQHGSGVVKLEAVASICVLLSRN